jgi:hypothetical protein
MQNLVTTIRLRIPGFFNSAINKSYIHISGLCGQEWTISETSQRLEFNGTCPSTKSASLYVIELSVRSFSLKFLYELQILEI